MLDNIDGEYCRYCVCRYERLAGVVGCREGAGVVASTQTQVTNVVFTHSAVSGDLSQVREAVAAALDSEELSIVNIMIHPMAGRRAQQHEWLTRAKL